MLHTLPQFNLTRYCYPQFIPYMWIHSDNLKVMGLSGKKLCFSLVAERFNVFPPFLKLMRSWCTWMQYFFISKYKNILSKVWDPFALNNYLSLFWVLPFSLDFLIIELKKNFGVILRSSVNGWMSSAVHLLKYFLVCNVKENFTFTRYRSVEFIVLSLSSW